VSVSNLDSQSRSLTECSNVFCGSNMSRVFDHPVISLDAASRRKTLTVRLIRLCVCFFACLHSCVTWWKHDMQGMVIPRSLGIPDNGHI